MFRGSCLATFNEKTRIRERFGFFVASVNGTIVELCACHVNRRVLYFLQAPGKMQNHSIVHCLPHNPKICTTSPPKYNLYNQYFVHLPLVPYFCLTLPFVGCVQAHTQGVLGVQTPAAACSYFLNISTVV